MTGESRDDDAFKNDGGDDSRPAPRNPFADPEEHGPGDRPPALIETKKSAALVGVIVGLVAMLLVAGICILGSIAFS